MMNITYKKPSELKPYPNNPRLNEDAVDKVARSISEFGFRQPIVVDKDNMIIVGHTRWKAALRLNLEKVPVHVAGDLTPEQIKAYRIADNKTGEYAFWDWDTLSIELTELADLNFDLDWLDFNGLGKNDPLKEWVGMPEFVSEDKTSFKALVVHFRDQEGIDEFMKLVGQKITDKTRFIWFPEIEQAIVKDKAYKSEP